MENFHKSVMVEEVFNHLITKKDGIYIDCTLGFGGHSRILLEKEKELEVIAFDRDETAITFCKNDSFFSPFRVFFINDNFVNFISYLKKLNIEKVNGFFFDLGVSSEQLSDPQRGFSYRQNSPLDMRMNPKDSLTAEKIINNF